MIFDIINIDPSHVPSPATTLESITEANPEIAKPRGRATKLKETAGEADVEPPTKRRRKRSQYVEIDEDEQHTAPLPQIELEGEADAHGEIDTGDDLGYMGTYFLH